MLLVRDPSPRDCTKGRPPSGGGNDSQNEADKPDKGGTSDLEDLECD